MDDGLIQLTYSILKCTFVAQAHHLYSYCSCQDTGNCFLSQAD